MNRNTSSANVAKARKGTTFIGALSILLAAFWSLSGCQPTMPTSNLPTARRHVLLVTVDTLRPDYLSANGFDLPTSPFLDSLLASGFTFTRAVAPVARTTPALASLLTGAYPRKTKVQTLVDKLATEVVSLAELAKQGGYATLAVVSNHILVPERGLGRGFDTYDFADDSRDAAATTTAALRHLARYEPDAAIFAWVHYIDPHVPYYPPAEVAKQFDPMYEGPYRLHFGDITGGVGNQAYPADLGKLQAVFRNKLPAGVNAHIRRLYAADIRHTDDHVARLVRRLRAEFGDDWLIIFTADHGESLGENDYFYDHGDYVSNAEIRVPLTFVFADDDPLHGKRAVGDWVSLVDVMPTVVELLDLSMPADLDYALDGRSLVPYMRGEDPPSRVVFAESGDAHFRSHVRRRVDFDIAGRFRTALLGDWKLVWTPGASEGLEFELYDVKVDPNETTNLYVPDEPSTERLKALLRQWRGNSDTQQSRRMSEADRERLRSLGYLE